MSQEPRKENKQAHPKMPKSKKMITLHQNEAKSMQDMFKIFTKQHSAQNNVSVAKIDQLRLNLEDQKLFESERSSQIINLQDFVNKKMEALKAMQENWFGVNAAQEKIAADYERKTEAYERDLMKYEEIVSKLTEDIKALKEIKANLNAVIMAKEAECAAYVNDMKTQLDASTEAANQLKEENNNLQAELADLKAKLLENQQVAEEYKTNVEKTQVELTQKTKKLLKKDDRIKKLKENLEALEKKNSEFNQKLEIQNRKMFELQNVLQFPPRRISTFADEKPTEPQDEVKPMRASIEPIQPLNTNAAAPYISQDIIESNHTNELNSLRILRSRNSRAPQPSYEEDSHSDDEIVDQSTESSPQQQRQTCSVSTQNRSSNQQLIKAIKNSTKRQFDDSSEIDFPAFRPGGSFMNKIARKF